MYLNREHLGLKVPPISGLRGPSITEVHGPLGYPQTPNPKPQTPNPKPQTLNPKQYAFSFVASEDSVVQSTRLTINHVRSDLGIEHTSEHQRYPSKRVFTQATKYRERERETER